MKQCAVVLNGNELIKISNLKRKYGKIMNNPNMKILEECDLDKLEEKYDYWNRTINRDKEQEIKEESSLKYYFKNPKTGETIVSIYPTLDKLRNNINNIDDYIKVDL